MISRYNLTFLVFFLGCISVLSAQKAELIGVVQPEGLPPVDIKLSFTLDNQGDLKGVSITDFYGLNQTVSEIEGRYSFKEKQLSFKEVVNISTYSEADSNAFCFIEVVNLPLDLSRDSSLIEGNFNGSFLNGDFCAQGKILLRSASFLEGMIRNTDLQNKITDLSAERQVAPYELEPETVVVGLDPLTLENPLRNQDQVDIAWENDTIKLSLWDSYEEDGDRVDVYINGRKELSNFKVKERKQKMIFIVKDPTVELQIVAVNEGTNPPCTVHALLADGDKVQASVVKLRKEESVIIRLHKS